MKATSWMATAGLALAGALSGQTIWDEVQQLRQIQIIPFGGASALPVPGEVTPISGKPYSAIARTVEYSPDGVHVDQSQSDRVYRDDMGRTRREVNGGKTVVIADPVAGLGYNLQTESKTAMKRALAPSRPSSVSLQTGNTGPINLKIMNQSMKVLYETIAKYAGLNVVWDPEIQPPVKTQFNLNLSDATIEQALDSVAAMTGTWYKALNPTAIYITNDNPVKRAAADAIPVTAPQTSIVEAAREQANRMSSGGRGGNGAAKVTVEDLGVQTVNGVAAQGVRTTSIIPTGTFGNDHDLKSVTERWVSEDLHVLVKSVYTDSRTGSTVYDLININQAAPDPGLFQVPAGYAVQEGGRGGRGVGPGQPRPGGGGR